MIIPKKSLRRFKILRERGDLKAINEESSISRPVLIRAFKGEDVEERVFVAIANFYAKREERIKSLA